MTPRESGWWERGRVTITSLTPTDDVELDRALRVLQEREGRKLKDLVGAGTGKRPLARGLRERLLERLAASGTLRAEHGTVLGEHPALHLACGWPGGRGRGALPVAVRAGLRAHADGTDGEPDRPLSVTGLLTEVVSTPDREAEQRLEARSKALTDGDWVARAVRDATQEAQAAGASASSRRRRGRPACRSTGQSTGRSSSPAALAGSA